MSIEVTDFVKRNILNAYGLMKDFLCSDVEDEQCYADMVTGIDKLEIGIPREIYAKIKAFIEEELTPLTYEGERVFADCLRTKEEMKEESDVAAVMSSFLEVLQNVNEKLHEFGMNVLYPHLV